MILGMSASKVARKGLLGFAIRRTDETEGERYWLRGMKTFHEVVPFQQPGMSYSLLEHPVQTFRWSDYTAKPGHNYIYEILPMRGTPKFLTEGEVVEVAISTESEGDLGEAHDVYFNRGVAASQAYSRRFGNQKPSYDAGWPGEECLQVAFTRFRGSTDSFYWKYAKQPLYATRRRL